MKMYVSATMYYGYEIEVPDEALANKDTFDIESYASEHDPLEPHGINSANCEFFINSIFDDEGYEYWCS